MINLEKSKKVYLKHEIKVFGSCDICNKNSSFANRTCNNCLGGCQKSGINYFIHSLIMLRQEIIRIFYVIVSLSYY